ncbi:MAG: Jag N-terminal domain-containing protein [Sulfurimonas sp.]|uniref:Jag N-terminal domain-containing protein n=1 Tax=Sulfurimonas sp. TaxID=2022749 RepID=UPI00261652EF|nr:Jag N-terminal domain-containing protein [Sulfurimonas sp.]MDD2652784.1 Jag N-terminal domain-containing protein [Sulfurimonas sp.]MDD3452095.1 Jag N-terminal domain-containing protein [Sulfurimonas sp.]
MIKIESTTLEQACKDAASALGCSASELAIEIVQVPSNGFMGFFKKSAIIVAAKKSKENLPPQTVATSQKIEETKIPPAPMQEKLKEPEQPIKKEFKPQQKSEYKPKKEFTAPKHNIVNDTIMPESFVSTQEDDDYDMAGINYTADYDEEDVFCEEEQEGKISAYEVASAVSKEINELFALTCFKIDKIEVSAHDANTLLIEFKGDDAALLIGKEGYRYKALSYMIFNWINTKYQLQLRLEIAEFLKNQEESIARYLVTVCENIDRDGRAQTKILDGVLIQIALKELREKYPNKYVAVRSTRDGLKFIIINDYHN